MYTSKLVHLLLTQGVSLEACPPSPSVIHLHFKKDSCGSFCKPFPLLSGVDRDLRVLSQAFHPSWPFDGLGGCGTFLYTGLFPETQMKMCKGICFWLSLKPIYWLLPLTPGRKGIRTHIHITIVFLTFPIFFFSDEIFYFFFWIDFPYLLVWLSLMLSPIRPFWTF
jgi:hypothetical protein